MGSVFNYLQLLPIPFLDGNTKVFIMGFGRFQVLSCRVDPFCWERILPTSQKIATEQGNLLTVHMGILLMLDLCSAAWRTQAGPSAACTQAVISTRFQKKGTHCLFLEEQGVLQSKLLPCLPTSILLCFGSGTFRWDTAFHLVCSTHRRVKSDFSPRLGSSEAIISVFLML